MSLVLLPRYPQNLNWSFSFRACRDLALLVCQIHPALCHEYCIILRWNLKQIWWICWQAIKVQLKKEADPGEKKSTLQQCVCPAPWKAPVPTLVPGDNCQINHRAFLFTLNPSQLMCCYSLCERENRGLHLSALWRCCGSFCKASCPSLSCFPKSSPTEAAVSK